MLNACAPGVAVVNVDNGFGAGYLSAVINAGANPATGSETPGSRDGATSVAPQDADAHRLP